MTRPRELIGGPGAYLEVGRGWRCYNRHVRFGGATADAAVGLALYGGALLDLDVTRADESADGEDQFRELFPAPGFMGVQVESVEVVHSGEGGGDAVVRVRGRTAPLGVLPQVVLIEHRFDAEVVTDFVLHPEARHLEINTTVLSNEADMVDITLGDFLAMGSGVRAFTPESGFGEAPLFSSASVYAGVSPGVSYGYTVAAGSFTIPIVDAGGTATLVRSDVALSAAESYTRFVIVSDRGLAGVLAEAARIRGEATGALHVRLTRGGQPVGGVVTLYRDPLGEDPRAVNQLLVPAVGDTTEDVLPGTYVLKAVSDGTAVSAGITVTVGAGGTAEATVELGATARVTVVAHEVDAAGADLGPVPAKLSVVPVAAPGMDPDTRPSPGRGLVRYVVAADGELRAALPPGTYRLLASRGPEYSLYSTEITLADGDDSVLDAPLRRVLPTAGLISGEFHQHTLGSLDANTDLATKVLENAAEGVELAAATDHDNVKDYAPYVEQLGLRTFFTGWAGNEISYNGVGHFNAYPLEIPADDPFRDVGARLWAGRTVAELFAMLRALPSDPVIHVSHPRANNGKGYFSQIHLDPVTGEVHGLSGSLAGAVPPGTFSTLADDFDAMEVNEELADPALLEPGTEAELERRARDAPTSIPQMVDWFHLLLTGHHVAALGNSDSHDFNSGSGWPRNYIVVGDDRPDAITRDEVRAAIRSQRVLVSNGLLVTPRTAGTLRLGRGDPVTASGASVAFEVLVESAAWLGGGSELTIFRDGRPLHLAKSGGDITMDTTGPARLALQPTCNADACRDAYNVTVPFTQDGWIVFVVRGSGDPSPVGRGNVWAYSNPVYVDADGNGWNAP
ncbi:MAG: CehA/McbA family metallohydrolase [Deltaproteobacteria bacterium]|nr:CehA/McbA family metallohydrolase [Deltaproteobacteria bacterium]